MNGISGTASPAGLWSEARNAEGRVYYYNKITKATQWTKPQELMTPVERALAEQPWQEYSTKDGRKYWSHRETKQSTWEAPESFKAALAQAAPAASVDYELLQEATVVDEHNVFASTNQSPQFVAGGTATFAPSREEQATPRASAIEAPPASRTAMHTDPDYAKIEEAEAVFMKMLRRAGVQSDWTWEQTMRATVKEPQYRALKDPRDRKRTFEKYAVETRIQERDRAKERMIKLRADFATMLKSHPEIKYYTRWKTARPIIEGETIFRSSDNDDERRQLYDEYIAELKSVHTVHQAEQRQSAMNALTQILDSLELEPYTRWAEAQEKIHEHKHFRSQEKFQALTKSDVLTAFENHIKALERTFNDERQREKQVRVRRERINRDRFIDLLRELKTAGQIKITTKWKDLLPQIADEPRYQAMLGQGGSNALELFWDVLEEEERALRKLRNDVYDVLEERRYEITTTTEFEAFSKLMAEDARTNILDQETLQLIFERLLIKVRRREADDKHAAERQQRHLVDDLRSRIKRLDRSLVTVDTTWEQLRPHIADLAEFKALEDEETRKTALDKVIRRLREKEEDGASRRAHRSKRASRSPEMDAYEADRRRAVADRERNFHKSGPRALTPPAPLVERRDSRSDRLASYQPRKRDELDYGIGTPAPAPSRRRRDSDLDSRGSSHKRPRRSDQRRTSNVVASPPKEEPAVHSGSEEGEMVEE